MKTETPQLVISRVFDAPRELVYRAFTDPDHLAAWWGPIGNSLRRDEIEFDVRPGGFQRWTEVNAAEPGLRVHIRVDLTDVAEGELLEGVMHLTVGGANLAAQAFKAGLVDECQLFVWPVVVGGGKSGLPTGMRADLELLDERRFRNGVVHLRYRPLGQ